MRSDDIGIPFKAVEYELLTESTGIFPLSILMLGAVYVEGGRS